MQDANWVIDIIAGGITGIWKAAVTSGSGVRFTAHGAQRIAGATATRGGVLTMEVIKTTKSIGRVFTQADGAKVYLHEITSGRFNAVVENSAGKVITTMGNWSQNSINRIAKNYGWKIQY